MKPNDWCPAVIPLQEKPIDGVLIGVIVTVVICGGIVLIKILHWIN